MGSAEPAWLRVYLCPIHYQEAPPFSVSDPSSPWFDQCGYLVLPPISSGDNQSCRREWRVDHRVI